MLVAALAISNSAFGSQTNVLVNGDFEEPAIQCGLWNSIPEGSGYITGWNVNCASTNNATGGCNSWPYYSHSVDILFCSTGPIYVHTGHQSIDTAGTFSTPGDSIYQDVPTKPGVPYTLTFYTSSNGGEMENGLTVAWDDIPISTITTPPLGQWSVNTITIVASSELSRLRFVGNIGGGGGSILDTVSLVSEADDEPPVVSCPPSIALPSGSVPPAATNVAQFTAQGGSISDNQDPNPSVVSSDEVSSLCPMRVTRTYTVTDAAGNASQCQQLIAVQNRFGADGILWFPPVVRPCRTNEYVFEYGRTIPIKIRPRGCDGSNLARNTNIVATLQVLALSDCRDSSSAQPVAINDTGDTAVRMKRGGGHFKYDLHTKILPADIHCFLLKATVTDVSTGESLSESLPIQSR